MREKITKENETFQSTKRFNIYIYIYRERERERERSTYNLYCNSSIIDQKDLKINEKGKKNILLVSMYT